MLKLNGHNIHTVLTVDRGEISNLCQYKCCGWFYYQYNKYMSPFNIEVLGRVLGSEK